MTVCSAPGKVYLFGEHAVIYGEPAVPCAIERRATVHVEPREDDRIRIEAKNLTLDGFTVEYTSSSGHPSDVGVPTPLIRSAVAYVDAAIDQARDALDRPNAGFDIVVESDIPVGGGLGSSAAVVVASIDAATRAFGYKLDPREIARRAFKAEYKVQDGQASRADTFCSAMGGAVRVEGDDCRVIDIPSLPFVIGFDGGAGDTGELAASVRKLHKKYDFASETINTIGDIVRTGEQVLADADPTSEASEELLTELGRLMDFDQELLSMLGVSSLSLDAMVRTARSVDAYGAKLTGAGGGGCIVALDPTDGTETALEFTPGCQDAFRSKLADEGVRMEVS